MNLINTTPTRRGWGVTANLRSEVWRSKVGAGRFAVEQKVAEVGHLLRRVPPVPVTLLADTGWSVWRPLLVLIRAAENMMLNLSAALVQYFGSFGTPEPQGSPPAWHRPKPLPPSRCVRVTRPAAHQHSDAPAAISASPIFFERLSQGLLCAASVTYRWLSGLLPPFPQPSQVLSGPAGHVIESWVVPSLR